MVADGERSAAGELAVVVVNFGSSTLLRRAIDCLEADGAVGPTVVVVDNWSTAEERAEVVRLCRSRGWSLVAPEQNLGFGRGANLGVERARSLGCSAVLLLNPDVQLDRRGLDRLAREVQTTPRTLVSASLVTPDGTTWFSGGRLDLDHGFTQSRVPMPADGPARWLTGACLVISMAAWEELGGFDPDYFLYWEDVDLSWRAQVLGLDLRVVEEVVAIHDVGATQRSRGKSTIYAQQMCRNRLLFASRHLPGRAQLRWLLATLRFVRRVLPLGGPEGLLRRPSMAWAVVRGSAGGVRALVRSAAFRVGRSTEA